MNPLEFLIRYPFLFSLVLALILYIIPVKRLRFNIYWALLGILAIIEFSLNTGIAATAPLRDHVEGSCINIAWLWLKGWPIHPAIDAAQCYALPYGPLGYILISPGLYFGGPHLHSAIITPILACWGSVILVLLACRKLLPWKTSLILTGIYCGLLFSVKVSMASYWIRPDPFILFFSALACWIIVSNKPWSLLTASCTAGLIATIKPHSFLPLAPLFFCLLYEASWRTRLSCGIAFVITIIAVYCIPGATFLNQLAFTKAITGHGLDCELLVSNIVYSFLLFLPLAACLCSHNLKDLLIRNAKNRTILLLTILVYALMLVPASRPGDGDHHLLPFAAPIIITCAWLLRTSIPNRLSAACLIGLLLSFTICIYYGIRSTRKSAQKNEQSYQAASSEVRLFKSNHPGEKIFFGVGSEWGSYCRLVPLATESVLEDSTIVFNVCSYLDFVGADLPLSPACEKALLETYDVWAIPAGEKPLHFPSYRPGREYLFTTSFMDKFNRQFKLTHHGKLIDFYTKSKPE